MAKFLSIGILLLLSAPIAAQTQITLYSDHPLDIKLTQETLNSNVLNALEMHADGDIHFLYQLVPLNRSWLMLEKSPSCLINQIKTPEREAKAYFSRFPMNLYPPLRLIVPDAKTVSWPDEFTPAEFNLAGQNMIGLVKGRSYGSELDGIFAKTPQYYYIRGGTEPAERIIDMLIAKRITATIDYSRSVRSYLNDTDGLFEFKAIPIAGQTVPVAGYIACSKDNQGKAMIKAIDSVFAEDAMLQDYLQFHREYFGEQEASLLEPFIREYHRQLIELE
ncbi:hypothetical protein [Shewanella sp.]|uniref:hypothetical protein n=1 Tax=Shewanella sp. TaxID=50422 RepID=UPI00356B3C17